MATGQQVTEDLKAFERRLMEYISCLGPKTGRWRSTNQKQQETARNPHKVTKPRFTDFKKLLPGCIISDWLLHNVVLIVSSVFAAVGAWGIITDNQFHPSLIQYLWHHKLFTFSCFNLIILFILGIHRRVMAPQIILARARIVLEDYNMACDEKGRLILKPRPS